MKQKQDSNTKQGHRANMLLYAVAPNLKLSTDAIALEGAVVSRGNGIGATSETYLMDCIVGIKHYPDKYFDLAVVDPPYGIGYSELVGKKKASDRWKERKSSKWDNAVPSIEYFTELFRVSKNQIIWGGNYFDLPPTRCFIIWDKVQRIDQADCEFAWTSFEKSARVFNYARGNESGFAPKLKGAERAGINIHPTQKPIALYSWIFKNYSEPGQRVIDTHLGSGSSRISAHKYGLNFTGFEIDEEYYYMQEGRFSKYQAQLNLFENTREGCEHMPVIDLRIYKHYYCEICKKHY